MNHDHLNRLDNLINQARETNRRLDVGLDGLDIIEIKIKLKMRIQTVQKKIGDHINLQKNNNILKIMEIYDILQPLVKEKNIIKNIIDMKTDMELCDLRNEEGELKKQLSS